MESPSSSKCHSMTGHMETSIRGLRSSFARFGFVGMSLLRAILLYFAIVFGAGFLLGPIRVLALEPRLGPVFATLCESPFLITAMIIAARWVPSATNLSRDRSALLCMGFGALALQQLADYGVGIGIRGLTASEQIAHFATPEGGIYAALLILFALMPFLIDRWIRDPKLNRVRKGQRHARP